MTEKGINSLLRYYDALASKIQMKTITGTGTHNTSSNAFSIAFNFAFTFVYCFGTEGYAPMVATNGFTPSNIVYSSQLTASYAQVLAFVSGQFNYYPKTNIKKSSDGKTIYWYYTDGGTNGGTGAAWGYDGSGKKYALIAMA